MKTLPKKLQRLIKEERFSFDNTEAQHWGGRMNIKYRITWIKLEDEYGNRNIYNPEWSTILVNLKVKGTASTGRPYGRNNDTQQDIKKLTRCKKTYWDGYESTYSPAWGYQSHKRIREEIRSKVKGEIKDYLKLMGITGGGYGDGIKVNTITFEK